MNILWLFDTCGYIFGPAIMLAGLVAFGLCLWMTLRSHSRRPRRLAVGLAVLPMVLGLCGFLVGLVVALNQGVPMIPWLPLGKVCLAGAVTSAGPLIWTLLLFRDRGKPNLQVVAE